MGHKTHPLGFRLGITEPYRSFWYSDLKQYSNLIQEDYLLRNIIYDYWKNQGFKLKYEYGGISTISIYRDSQKDLIKVEIQTTSPGLIVGKAGAGLTSIDKAFTRLYPKKKIILNIIEIKEPFDKADIIAEELVRQLQLRMPFRRAMKQVIENAQKKNVKGLKVQISGRLNGADIARTEWLREGRVPLQTLRANIDYSYQTAQTVYGILGVKIWLFKGERHSRIFDEVI